MKDGAVICNSGHFNVEIDIPALEKMSSTETRSRASFVLEYSVRDGEDLSCREGRPDQSCTAEAMRVQW